jgi:TfoX/Sxy family transcriptional regulator of competence genes
LALKNIAFNSSVNYRYFYTPSSRIRFIDSNLIKDIKIKLENSIEFDITDNIIHYFSNFLSTMFLSDFENSLRNSFGDITTLKNKISNGQFYFGIEFDDYIIHISEESNKLILKYDGKGKKYLCRKVQQHRYPKDEGDHIVLYYTEEEQFLEDIQAYFNKLYKRSVLSILSNINNVYYLPA